MLMTFIPSLVANLVTYLANYENPAVLMKALCPPFLTISIMLRAVRGFTAAHGPFARSNESLKQIKRVGSEILYYAHESHKYATFFPISEVSTPSPTLSIVPQPSAPMIS